MVYKKKLKPKTRKMKHNEDCLQNVQSANEEWKWPHAVIGRSSREIARCKKIVHPMNRPILCN